MQQPILKINVGGKYFATSRSTFLTKCYPNWFSNYLEYKPETTYIFIDKNPKYFEIILDHLRGYTTTIPTEEAELIKLYEDTNFYGIHSMLSYLEEVLHLRMSDYKRDLTKTYIKDTIQKYNIKSFLPMVSLINQLTDKQLTETQTKIENIKLDCDKNERVNRDMEIIVKFMKKIEDNYSLGDSNLLPHNNVSSHNNVWFQKGISKKLFENRENIRKFLKDCDEASFRLVMILLECII